MTIKRRMLIANLCMVGIPVAATLAARVDAHPERCARLKGRGRHGR